MDLDQDGRIDVELARDYTLARLTDAGFVFEPLPPAPPGSVYTCRRSVSSTNPPRLLAQLRSGVGDETSYVVDLVPNAYRTATTFRACDRLGVPITTQTLAGDWAPSATVRLVDVNRDHRPDLVRVQYGAYKVLPNASTATAFVFGSVREGTLAPAFTPDTAWVHDINGDGIVDLVARSASEIWVWFGKGNFEFETQGRRFLLRASNGALLVPSSYSLTFVDANRDGLADVVLSRATGNSTYLYMNTGTAFEEASVPALAAVDSYTSKPVVADVRGTGDVEVTFQKSGQGYAVALDAPGVGLLATADDGKGTVLSFEYARAPAWAAARARQPVLSRLYVDSSGQEPTSFEYGYAQPRIHSIGKFLLGYDAVTRWGPVGNGLEPLGSESTSFLNDDRFAGILQASASRDALAPGLERFVENSYEDATYQGISWKRLVREEAGWRATDGTGPRIANVTRNTAWWGDFCQAQVVKDTSAGTLTLDTQYATLASFTGHLACLPVDITETGTHFDPTLSFRHETAISRNDLGLVTRVSSVATPSDIWTLQDVTYTPEWLVETVSAPGQGTTTAAYDPSTRLITRVTSPEGAVVEAVERDALTDGTTLLRTTRGLLVHEQHFRFDGQERLQSAWDNVGSGSASNPDAQFAYQFATLTAPASISASVLVDAASMSVRETVDLLTASGQPVATGTRIPEGWSLGALTWRDAASGQTTAYVRPAIATSALTGLDYGTLFAGANQGELTTSGPFGIAIDHTTALHSDVQRSVAESLSIDPTTMRLVKNARENGTFDQTIAMDASNRVLTSWDEAGTAWGYVYDAMGRAREVQLPDGKKHRTRYDGHGRVSRVEREGIATVEYAYDAVTGLLREKKFISPGGTLRRTVTLVRDGIGRVEREIDTDVASGGSKTFRYYFDGATPENPSATNAIGLLTAVSGDGYVKRLEYRDDAKITKRTVDIGDWRRIVTSVLYNEAGEPAGQSVSVSSGATLLIATSMADQYDMNGRLQTTTFGANSTATYTYDADGRLASVTFPTGNVSLQYDAYTRRQIGSTQTSPAYTATTLQRMNARALPEGETLQVGTLSLSRQFGYSDQRYLTSSVDAQSSYSYSFDRTGVPTRIVENGAATDLVSSGNILVAGSITYVFDDLGRTVQRGDLVLAYGPDGQIASATLGARTWTFIHDEAGQRLAKLENGVPVAAYPAEGYLDATQLVESVKLGGRTIGVLRNGAFENVATDLRGTLLADADGSPRIASPFGHRDVRPALSPAVDYVEKGFDADLGLVRMGIRDYDPEINRFTTPDPLFLEDLQKSLASPVEANLYSYARNAPLNFVDPRGTESNERPAVAAVPFALPQSVPTQPTIICHGVSAQGFGAAQVVAGDYVVRYRVEDFAGLSAVAGSGPNARQGYRTLHVATDVLVSLAGPSIAARFVRAGVAAAAAFENGALLERTIATPKGNVGVLAEVEIEGRTLHLKDITMFGEGTKPLEGLGREMMQAKRALVEEARAAGFESLRITGQRVATSSSAKPGKMVDLVVDLTKK